MSKQSIGFVVLQSDGSILKTGVDESRNGKRWYKAYGSRKVYRTKGSAQTRADSGPQGCTVHEAFIEVENAGKV